MKKYLMGFLFFAVLSSTVHAQDAWKEFVYTDKQMAFSMPTNPAESSQSSDTAIGKITIYEYQLDKGSYALTVMMNDYPDTILQVSPDKLLAAGRDGGMKNINGKVTSEKKITIDGNPGLEFQFESSTIFGKYRIYLVGTRLYQISSVSSVGSTLFPDTDRFLNSFRLVKP
jgi:hypothetical protein